MSTWLWLVGLIVVVIVIYSLGCRRFYRKHFYKSLDFDDRYFGKETPLTRDLTERGLAMMKDSKVVVCALARDVASNLPMFIRRIEALGSYWQDYRVVIYENDSSDATPHLLRQWQAANPRVLAMTEKLQWPSAVKAGLQSVARFNKMAYCRNRCLQVVKQAEYNSFQYVMVTETDLKGGFSIRGIANSLGWESRLPWDAMIAYGVHLEAGLRFFYDPLAFKSIEGRRVRWFRPPQIPAQAKDISCLKFFWMARKNDRPFRVQSSGGGVWLYKRPVLLDAMYQGKDCEHISLHEQLISQGHNRIYVNPSMLVVAGAQGFGQFRKGKFKKNP